MGRKGRGGAIVWMAWLSVSLGGAECRHVTAGPASAVRPADSPGVLVGTAAQLAKSPEADAANPPPSKPVPEKPAPGARGPQSPAAERASFQLADPELTIELVAAEPAVSSPVAISWDPDGRMYVAEMIGYPTTEGLCRIRRLEDRDGDGRYEHAVTFAEGLSFPAGVMPYRKGVLVAAAPDILYLEDSDGDGRADVRRVEWTGFGTGSQQLRANSLHWGLDNWIYGANGRCDGEVRRPDDPEASAVSIRTRDFRFIPPALPPKRGEGKGEGFEAIVGQSQFGQVHDDWGNRFLSWNTIPVRHVLLEERYLRHQPSLATEAVVNVADLSDTGQVFPISPPPRQFNTEQANYYNAMCGLTIYRGDRLGPAYEGNAFVCESLSNLVTRRVLEPAGPTFVARRGEENREFLASTDSWFHPVNLTTGPDGALYVADFYREFVEHPIYVANEKTRAEVNWRTGAEHGRIWRITRKDAARRTPERNPRLSRAPTAELVELLGHPVGWWRDTAQRLLVERQDADAIAPLRNLVREGAPGVARLHALWTLHGLEGLDDASRLTALQDPDARLRRHAVRLAEERLNVSEAVRAAALALSDDPDLGVRFQLALTLEFLESEASANALAALLEGNDERWMPMAVLCSSARTPWVVLSALTKKSAWMRSPTVRQATLLEKLAEQLGARGDDAELSECVAWLIAPGETTPETGRLAILAGLAKGLDAQGTPLQPFGDEDGVQRLRALFDAAVQSAQDDDLPPPFRVQAVSALAHGRPDGVAPVILALMQPSQPQPVQSAAARAAANLHDTALSRTIYERWQNLTSVTRQEIFATALCSPAATEALVDALEQDKVLAVELPAELREALRHVRNAELQSRIQKVLAAAAPADRQQVLARYQEALTLRGDGRRGAVLFKEHCLTCHVVQGVGQRVGPDLSGAGARRNDILLVDMLDPSRQLSPDFTSYVLTTKEGKVLTGLIVAETAGSVTLRRSGGEEDTVPRGNIEELRASGKSVMPDGLEEKLGPAQLADVLEFLRRPDSKLLQ